MFLRMGMGAKGVRTLIDRVTIDGLDELWLLGVCGAVVPKLGAGDWVWADSTCCNSSKSELLVRSARESDRARLAIAAQEIGVAFHVGRAFCSDKVLTTRSEKTAAAETGAIIVEMESWPLIDWVQRQSNQHPVAFQHVRVVMDSDQQRPLVWRRPGEFFRDVFPLATLRELATAHRSLRRLATALTQPGGVFSQKQSLH